MLSGIFLFLILNISWSYNYNLEKLGYPQGYAIQQSIQNVDFFFPLPLNTKNLNGFLTIDLDYSALLKEPSNLKVFVNDELKSHQSLSSEKAPSSEELKSKSFKISLNSRDFKDKFVKVRFSFFNFVTGDPCLDQELSSGLVRIKESTGLTFNSPTTNDLDSFFLNLGKETLIYTNLKKFSSAETKALFDLVYFLSQYQTRISWTSLKDEADIVLNQENNFIKLEGKKLHYSISTSSELNHELLNLYSSQEIKTSISSIKNQNVIFRDELGLGAIGLKTTSGVEWNFTYNPRFRGENSQPNFLNLSFIAPQSKDKKAATYLYVYLNEELVKSTLIEKVETAQFLRIDFPNFIKKFPFNVKIVIKEENIRGKCGLDVGRDFDHQLLADTYIELKKANSTAKNFAEFAISRRDKIEVSLNDSNPNELLYSFQHLIFLSKMFSFGPEQFDFVSNPGPSKQPFIKIGKLKDDLELRIKGNYLANLSGKNNLAVLELVEADSQQGLSLKYRENFYPTFYPPTADLNKLMIYSDEKIALLTNTQSLLGQIPELSLFDRIIPLLQKWRFYLMALSWLLLTLIFIRVGKKLRK